MELKYLYFIQKKKKTDEYMNRGGISYYKAYLVFRLKIKGDIKWDNK